MQQEQQRQPQLLGDTQQHWQQQHQQQHVYSMVGNRMMVVSQAATANYGHSPLGIHQPPQQQQLVQQPAMIVASSSHGLSLQRTGVSLPQQQQQQQQVLLLPVAFNMVAAEGQHSKTAAPFSSQALTGSSWAHHAAQLQAIHTQQQQQQQEQQQLLLQLQGQRIAADGVYGGSAASSGCFGSSMLLVSSVTAAAAAVTAAAGDAMSDCSSWSAASVAEITCGMLPLPAPAKSAAAGVACDADHLHHTLQQQLVLSGSTKQASCPETWSQAADVACLFSPATTATATDSNAPTSAQPLSLFVQSNGNSSGSSSNIGQISRLAPTAPMLDTGIAMPLIGSSSGGLFGSSQAFSRGATAETLSLALHGQQLQPSPWHDPAIQPW
jgi:hypothetical protein